MHEIDHRFTVEGRICGPGGKPVADTQVIVKDPRVSVGASTYTDRHGHYKATLHLHNDNRGDPVVVVAQEQEKRVTAEFDPKDVKTERRVTVDFGPACAEEADAIPTWVYYGAGAGALAALAAVGARVVRKRKQPGKRGKGQKR